MNENKFWVCIWAIVASMILGIGLIIAQASYENNRAIESALKAAPGADPMAVSCAMNIESQDVCKLYSLRK